MKYKLIKRRICGNCNKKINWKEKCLGWKEGTQCLCNPNLAIHYNKHKIS